MDFSMANGINNHLKLSKDLLIEMFVRSSVESLIREKCVCKQWYALIKNPEFISHHIHYQKRCKKGRLLIQYCKVDTKQYGYALFDDETLVSDSYHDLARLSAYAIIMDGPINGIYCLFNDQNRIVLWNPALLEFLAIPLPHTHFFPNIDWSSDGIGFGIDPFTQNFKLIIICDFSNYWDFMSPVYVIVYDLTTNTWRLLYELGNSDTVKSRGCNTSFFDGIYYWCYSRNVVGFDMGKEIFREIMGPELPHSESCFSYLSSYNDKIALLVSGEFHVDIWVMLQESVWEKQFSVTSLPEKIKYIGLWKNDELFYAFDDSGTNVNPISQIVFCNASNQEKRNLGPIAMVYGFQASVYCESMQSVDFGMRHNDKCISLNKAAEFLKSDSNPYLDMSRASD